MNRNVKDLKSEIEISRAETSEVFIKKIANSLNEAKKYAEMLPDPELRYLISMAEQCNHEKFLISIYENS